MRTYNEENKEDLLPKLNDEEIDWAIAPEQKSWVYNALSRGPGYVWVSHENGYAMQIGWKGFELLSIVDHEWCTHYVSLINAMELECPFTRPPLIRQRLRRITILCF